MRSSGRASLKEEGVTRRGNGRARDIVRQLAAVLAARNDQHAAGLQAPGAARVISTGWDAIDRVLAKPSPRIIDSVALAHIDCGGLQRGMLHEWLGHEESLAPHRRRCCWLPPHSLFIHLAWRAMEAERDAGGLVVWIGRRVWPQALALKRFATEITENTERMFGILDFKLRKQWFEANAQSSGSTPISNHKLQIPRSFSVPSVISVVKSPCLSGHLLSHSIFIDPPDDASRLWAVDLALRSAAAGVVIADGSKLKMAESRRLQLAAERGRSLALLARPAWETHELSAASTRWRVCRTPSDSSSPRWIVELLRCKHGGASQGDDASSVSGNAHERSGGWGGRGGRWEIEYASPGHLRLVADVVDRSGSPSEAEGMRALSFA